MATIHLFLADDAWSDRTAAAHPGFGPGGVGQLSMVGLSYYRAPFVIHDKRAPSVRDVWWAAQTKPRIIIEQEEYAAFIARLQAISTAELDSFFAVMDQVVYKYDIHSNVNVVDGILSVEAPYGVYVPGSLSIPSAEADTENGNIYFDTPGPATLVRVPKSVLFSIEFTTGGATVMYDVRVWATNNGFRAGYPLTKVMAVVPPLPYARLLNDSLTGTGTNSFQTASLISSLSVNQLQEPIEDADITGYMQYQVRIYDSAGNMVTTWFNMAYKGQVPDRLVLRQAARTATLASGVGTDSQWRARIPGLFVDGRFYITPMFNNTTDRPDQVIFPSVINWKKFLDDTKAALPFLDASSIEDHAEFITTAYQTLIASVTPHPLNGSAVSFRALHPSYQAYGTTDTNFQNMAGPTRQFASTLITTLAVASGNTTNTLYPVVTDNNTDYVPFEVGAYEYYVMTKESFLNLVEEP